MNNAIIQPVGCIFNPLRPISGIICHIHRVVEAVGKHIVTRYAFVNSSHNTIRIYEPTCIVLKYVYYYCNLSFKMKQSPAGKPAGLILYREYLVQYAVLPCPVAVQLWQVTTFVRARPLLFLANTNHPSPNAALTFSRISSGRL